MVRRGHIYGKILRLVAGVEEEEEDEKKKKKKKKKVDVVVWHVWGSNGICQPSLVGF
jgi:hypothetical protein